MQERIKNNFKKEEIYKKIIKILLIFLTIINFILSITIFINQKKLEKSIILIILILNSLLIISTMLILLRINILKKENKDIYKEEIENLLKNKINIQNCEMNNFLNASELYNIGIIPYFDSSYGSFLTSYLDENNNECIFSNLELKLKLTENEEYSAEKKIFKGQVYVLKYPKKIKGTLRILASSKYTYLNLEFLDNLKEKTKIEKKIETANIDFNDNFEVFSTDEHSAFYVLNNNVIETLLNLKKYLNIYYICIKNDKLIIAIKSNKTFFYKKTLKETIENFNEDEINSELEELLDITNIFNNLFS